MKNKNADLFFLQNGGEAADIIKNINWSASVMGLPENWSESLKTILANVLGVKFPMMLWWGKELVHFYNDSAHSCFANESNEIWAMGQKAADSWPETWSFIHPPISKVLTTGESEYYEDQVLPIFRNGRTEDTYWTFSYSAVFDDHREINGVLVICKETTDQVKCLHELVTNSHDLEFAINTAGLATFDLNPVTYKFSSNNRLKEWLGLGPDSEIPIWRAIASIDRPYRNRVRDAIATALEYENGGKFDIKYTIKNPGTKRVRTVHARGQVWFDHRRKPYRFTGTIQDVTAPEKVLQVLGQSRHLTDFAIENMGLGLFNFAFANDFIEYSAQFSKIFTGSEKRGLHRKDFEIYLHPGDTTIWSQALEKSSQNGIFYYSARVIWDDGSVHHIGISAVVATDAKGAHTVYGIVADITQQEQNRIALESVHQTLEKTKREAEKLISIVTDSSPTGLWFSDKKGLFTYFNKKIIDFTGQTSQGLLEGGWTSAILPEDLATAISSYQQAVDSCTHFDILFRAIKIDGGLIWCRAAGDPFYDAEGNYAGFLGFCMDMEDIISGRKALVQSQQHINLMIVQSPMAICLFTGIDMKIEIANDIMIGYWGTDKSVIGLPLMEAAPEFHDQPLIAILNQVYSTGAAYYGKAMPIKLLVNDILNTYYFDLTYTPIRDSKGKIYGIIGVAIDVTQQDKASQKLEETQMVLTRAIELAELGTWKLDIVTRMISCSPRFTQWLGLTENKIHQDDFLECIATKHHKKIMGMFLETPDRNPLDFNHYEFPIINKLTGTTRIIHINVQLLYTKGKSLEYLIATAQDITKQRAFQKELKFKVSQRIASLKAANNKLKTNNMELKQFAYIASHDLQEPIRKISIFSNILQNNLEKDPTKSSVYLEKIIHSTRRMENLIKDVLVFSQLTNTVLHFESVDLNHVFEQVLEDFDLSMEQKKATITLQQMPVVDAIPVQMYQLFSNLISNALKYSKKDVPPHICITANTIEPADMQTSISDLPRGKYVQITVSDNGIGFDQGHAEQIFNIFQRLHGKGEFAGTGIGLAMCRKILQNHKGQITASSQQGIGTVFTIVLRARHDIEN